MLTFAARKLSTGKWTKEDAASFFCPRSFDRAGQVTTVTAGRATRNSYKSPSSDDAAPAQRSESFGPGWPQSAEKAGTSTVGQPDVGAAPGRARTV